MSIDTDSDEETGSPVMKVYHQEKPTNRKGSEGVIDGTGERGNEKKKSI